MSSLKQRFAVRHSFPLVAAAAIALAGACGLSDPGEPDWGDPVPGPSTGQPGDPSQVDPFGGQAGTGGATGGAGSTNGGFGTTDFSGSNGSSDYYDSNNSGSSSSGFGYSGSDSTDQNNDPQRTDGLLIYGSGSNNNSNNSSANGGDPDNGGEPATGYMVRIQEIEHTTAGIFVCEFLDWSAFPWAFLPVRFIFNLYPLFKWIHTGALAVSVGDDFFGCDWRLSASVGGGRMVEIDDYKTNGDLVKHASAADLVGRDVLVLLSDDDKSTALEALGLSWSDTRTAVGICRGTITQAHVDSEGMEIPCYFEDRGTLESGRSEAVYEMDSSAAWEKAKQDDSFVGSIVRELTHITAQTATVRLKFR